jgi:hypothetical protein
MNPNTKLDEAARMTKAAGSPNSLNNLLILSLLVGLLSIISSRDGDDSSDPSALARLSFCIRGE